MLFDELKLPVQKRTDLSNEPSTDQETLEKLAALGHAVPKKIIEHRQISKLKGTYVDALPALVNPKTGRVHTSFNQTVAATGRLSSSDPNLQNIPARTDMGREIRQAFLPKDGWMLADRRLLADRAAAAGPLQRRRAAAGGVRRGPRHPRPGRRRRSSTCRADEVTSDQRRVAKTVNFGVIYGMSAFGLAERLGIDRKEAEKFIDEYFARYPKVLDYQDELLEEGPAGRVRRDDPRPAAEVRPVGDPRPTRATTAATRRSARRSTWRSRAPPPT